MVYSMKYRLFTEIKLFLLFVILVISIVLFVGGICEIQYMFPSGKVDYNCSYFQTRAQLMIIADRAGWPQKDPYNLSRGKSTEPCSSYKYIDD